MKTRKFLGFIVLIAVIALTLSLTGCPAPDDGGGNSGSRKDLSGTITITPNTGVTVNTKLTATYSGSETVTLSYQWKKDGGNVGTNDREFTPTQKGSYTVTISAEGYNSKISEVVDVNDPSLPVLSGTITITPNTGVIVNTELNATYNGSETVTLTYQWKKDGTNVGTNNPKFTPTQKGSYTVTVSAEGYNGKTSEAVDVNDISMLTLSGSIIITPNTDVNVNTELTATYSGSEAVTLTYQWKKDGTIVGTNNPKYTPATAGSYTVTVSAEGYNSKTSEAVAVNKKYNLGDTGPGGGRIFYVSIGGFTVQMENPAENYTAHYLEAAPDDMPTTLAWASWGFTSTFISDTGTAIGTGRKNTALILAKDKDAPAAKACKEYSNNGMTDWFLPSKDELYGMYENAKYLLYENGLYLYGSWYWSSSQSSTGTGNVTCQAYNGNRTVTTKDGKLSVRAARAF